MYVICCFVVIINLNMIRVILFLGWNCFVVLGFNCCFGKWAEKNTKLVGLNFILAILLQVGHSHKLPCQQSKTLLATSAAKRIAMLAVQKFFTTSATKIVCHVSSPKKLPCQQPKFFLPHQLPCWPPYQQYVALSMMFIFVIDMGLELG